MAPLHVFESPFVCESLETIRKSVIGTSCYRVSSIQRAISRYIAHTALLCMLTLFVSVCISISDKYSYIAHTRLVGMPMSMRNESESEMFLLDPYKKFIQSNNETVLDQGTPIKTSLVANVRAAYYIINNFFSYYNLKIHNKVIHDHARMSL